MQLLFLLLASYLIVSTYGQCSATRDCTSLGYPNNCCSEYGWCGTTSDYCGGGCQSGPCYSGSSSGGSSSGGSSSGSSSGGLSGKTIVTWYCSLSNPNGLGYCYNTGDPQHEADCAIDVTSIGSSLGVAANNPILFSKGASSVCQWNGANCGTCYKLSGPGGSKTIMVTDCCAGYPGSCECSQGCTASNCDWCAANDHNHFDLDYDSFSTVCGSEASQGNCVLSSAVEVTCPSFAVSENSAESEQTGQLSAGVLAGVVVGSLVGIILIVLVIVFSYRKSAMEVV